MSELVSRQHGQQLSVPAELSQLARVRAFVRAAAGRLGAAGAATADVVQAVDECVTNTIIHGYRGRPGEVEVELERAGHDLVVRLRDSAPPFDPTGVPPPDMSVVRRRLGGMGVHLARAMTDAMAYRRTQDGNELTLVKDCFERGEVER